MELAKIDFSSGDQHEVKTQAAIIKLNSLIDALREKELNEEVIQKINEMTSSIATSSVEKQLRKSINQIIFKISSLVNKEAGLTTKGYYIAIWTSIGMAAFGIPLGVIFGFALDNFAFMGLGLPMGLPIGIAIGMAKEKKAEQSGRVLTY